MNRDRKSTLAIGALDRGALAPFDGGDGCGNWHSRFLFGADACMVPVNNNP
jgi:hypothetical protein